MGPAGARLFSLAAVVLAGWLWGSFLNQVVERTPPRRGGLPAGVGLLRPARSLCLACRRPLPWHDNLPVLSYLWLGGRCRFCGAPIGRRTLALEAATPLLAAAWHEVARGAGLGWGVFAAGAALGSWLLVAAPVLAEGRRAGPGLVALGVLAGAGVVAALWLRL